MAICTIWIFSPEIRPNSVFFFILNLSFAFILLKQRHSYLWKKLDVGRSINESEKNNERRIKYLKNEMNSVPLQFKIECIDCEFENDEEKNYVSARWFMCLN